MNFFVRICFFAFLQIMAVIVISMIPGNTNSAIPPPPAVLLFSNWCDSLDSGRRITLNGTSYYCSINRLTSIPEKRYESFLSQFLTPEEMKDDDKALILKLAEKSEKTIKSEMKLNKDTEWEKFAYKFSSESHSITFYISKDKTCLIWCLS